MTNILTAAEGANALRCDVSDPEMLDLLPQVDRYIINATGHDWTADATINATAKAAARMALVMWHEDPGMLAQRNATLPDGLRFVLTQLEATAGEYQEFQGGNGAGGVALPDASLGDTVDALTGLIGISGNLAAAFESVISVDQQIQQLSAADLSKNWYRAHLTPARHLSAQSIPLAAYQQVEALFGPSIKTYYRITETSGSLLTDIVGGHHGTYNGPLLAAMAAPVFGDLAASLDGVNDDIDIYPGASSITPSTAGAILGWARFPVSAWADGTYRDPISIYSLAGDFIVLSKPNTANLLNFLFQYGGVNLSGSIPFSSPDWFSYCFTWSKAQNKFDFFANGYNPYIEQTGLGTWIEGLYVANCRLGGFGGGTHPFLGGLYECLFLDRLVTQTEFLAYTQIPNHLKKLALIGDSIEAAWNTWAYTVAGAKGAILKNHAVGGYGILNNGLQIETSAAAGDDADTIVIALGANDDNAGNMASLQATLTTNIDALRASNPRATIYAMNVLPKWTDSGGSTPVVMTNVRAAIAAGCAAKGVPCWDTFSMPWISAGQTTDGTHPTAAGHTAIANQVLARLLG